MKQTVPLTRLFYAQLGFLAAPLSAVLFSMVSYAAPGNLNPFFDTGLPVGICQGYNNTYASHTGASALALDLTGGICDNSAAGRTVHAPIAGQVYFYDKTYGDVCINTFDSRSIALIHINSNLSPSQLVSADQIVGVVGQPNTLGNAGIAHLHVQMWSQPNCTSGPIPFSSTENARICGAPDMPTIGPDSFNNGTWSGTTFTATGCTSSISASAAAVYRYYSPVVKRHLYTTDQNEANYLSSSMKGTWNYEGISYYVPQVSRCNTGSSVYRFYSSTLKTHLYTMDDNEKSYIMTNFPTTVWSYEGVSFCADKTQQNQNESPVYRFYSPSLKTHLYTNDANEKDSIIKTFSPDIWSYEGIAYYAYPI